MAQIIMNLVGEGYYSEAEIAEKSRWQANTLFLEKPARKLQQKENFENFNIKTT